ncbi:MAG: nucleotide exchange factor GrpE [Candidatus Margulisiibacteriota bacterium]|nr:nucleotide exchange factor GrpE [Candidatus Margulisiibacteriota bacterium]
MAKKDTKSDTKKTTKKSKPSTKKGKTISLEEFEAVSNELNDVRDQLLEKTKESDQAIEDALQLKEQSLRSLAELENVKRRKEQEKVDAIKYANEKLIMELLPVLDSFDLAMSQSNVTESDEVKAVITGFEMIKKQIEQFLDKCGVERIVALDQPFDPNLHQGISQESHPDKDENTVVKEMQPGYKLNDRVIRPSMVVVSTK